MARILIIEDNATNRRLTQAMLKKGGHKSLVADNADEGLRIVREERPDLVLMDIQLPGMDGLTATRHLKADPDTAAIPVIALTAFAMKGDDERMRAAGCNGYVVKPIRYREFLQTVKRLLAEPAREE